MGFVVAVRLLIDGVGPTSLFLIGVWIAATCFLWTLPQVLRRLGGKKVVLRDERGVLIYANSALVAHAVTWLFFVFCCRPHLLERWNQWDGVCECVTSGNCWWSRGVSGGICP